MVVVPLEASLGSMGAKCVAVEFVFGGFVVFCFSNFKALFQWISGGSLLGWC